MLVIGQCNRTVKGQLTHHACVSGQCNRTVKGQLTHHACVSGKNCNCFFFLEIYNWSDFFLKFCHSFD